MSSRSGFGTQQWANLVSETQFASDLVLTGIRRVSRLPMDGNIFGEISYSQTFPLHVGLHTYTSGLERLCKLAIACSEFLRTGSFKATRRFSHKLTQLLDGLETIDLTPSPTESAQFLDRPLDEFEPDLNAWLERYSSGGGRYELLDSLSSGSEALPTWNTWVEFCTRGSITVEVQRYIALHTATGEALRDLTTSCHLESVASGHLEEFDYHLSEKSAAVGIAMYRRVRWAASILDSITYYTNEALPILGEALVELRQTENNFFAFEIAKLSDPEPTEEELGAFFAARNIGSDEDEY